MKLLNVFSLYENIRRVIKIMPHLYSELKSLIALVALSTIHLKLKDIFFKKWALESLLSGAKSLPDVESTRFKFLIYTLEVRANS